MLIIMATIISLYMLPISRGKNLHNSKIHCSNIIVINFLPKKKIYSIGYLRGRL